MRDQFLSLTGLLGDTIFIRADAITSVQDAERGTIIEAVGVGQRIVREAPHTILSLPVNATVSATPAAIAVGARALDTIEAWVRSGQRTSLSTALVERLSLPGIPPWFPSETALLNDAAARAQLIFRVMQLALIEEATQP